jgi:hypothetical protein
MTWMSFGIWQIAYCIVLAHAATGKIAPPFPTNLALVRASTWLDTQPHHLGRNIVTKETARSTYLRRLSQRTRWYWQGGNAQWVNAQTGCALATRTVSYTALQALVAASALARRGRKGYAPATAAMAARTVVHPLSPRAHSVHGCSNEQD